MTLGDVVSRNRTAILGVTALLVGRRGLGGASPCRSRSFRRSRSIASPSSRAPATCRSSRRSPPSPSRWRTPGRRARRRDDPLDDHARRRAARPGLRLGQRHAARPAAGAGGDRGDARRAAGRHRDRSAPARHLGLPHRRRRRDSHAAQPGELSDFVIYEAAPQLRTIPGVLPGRAQRRQDPRVRADRRSRRRWCSIVSTSPRSRPRCADANIIAAGGQVRDGHQSGADRGARRGHRRRRRLLDVVVAEDDGIPVRLADVARVEPSLREDFTRAAANGETAVLIGVSRQPDGNAVTISAGVRAAPRGAGARASRVPLLRLLRSGRPGARRDRQRPRQHRHRPAAGGGDASSSSSPTCARPPSPRR